MFLNLGGGGGGTLLRRLNNIAVSIREVQLFVILQIYTMQGKTKNE